MHERSGECTSYQKESRLKLLTSGTRDLDLLVLKRSTRFFFPALLERRRRVDEALYALVVEAHNQGVSTRKVDDLG